MMNVSPVRVAPAANNKRPVAPAAAATQPVAKAPARQTTLVAEGVGAAVGAGYFAVIFRMMGALNAGGAILAVPGILVGLMAGKTLGKWAADGFKTHVNAGAVAGGLVLGGVYAFGALGLAIAESGMAMGLAATAPGVALAVVAGGAIGSLAQHGLAKLFQH